ncbi:redox-sensing transcriptional repressor Rex [Halanaerobium sp. Z-7514]|uniref:Redox-sensing transcriptional repressor Rex n=1 Tax=Halanaerobium polyolivorans TaxID=2886943 RepID=A0AAW4X0Z1_9FIRM|nr:redox-sensing transcriptional repressor Rex [Halanaerobium polyolivorans]MCC3145452.1 redox-sensing transcriptional repressor Rex [Halanaerobium polyolivorans]
MDKRSENIPNIIIRRLPIYYKHLKKLKNRAKEYISSEELAELTGFSSSLIRKDLSYFGNFGRKSYGYDIYCLLQELSIIMGFNHPKNLIIVGAGHLGQALVHNKGYEERGYKLKGVFDKNPKLIGLFLDDIKIRSVEEMCDFVKEEKIDIAALTVPKGVAQKTAELLIEAGVIGIWDFTEVALKVPNNILLEEQHINEGLCKLSCKINQNFN